MIIIKLLLITTVKTFQRKKTKVNKKIIPSFVPGR